MPDLEMPAHQYEADRHTWFQLVARHAKVTPLQLRVALSNVFVTMTTRHRQRPNTTEGASDLG